jgi:hypothetical protein
LERVSGSVGGLLSIFRKIRRPDTSVRVSSDPGLSPNDLVNGPPVTLPVRVQRKEDPSNLVRFHSSFHQDGREL